MEDRYIPDNRITASSTWEDNLNFGPSNARLNRPETSPTTGSWTAKINDLNQWIQADLGGLKQVSGVVTQGRNGGYNGVDDSGTQWVTKFKVSYSEVGTTWSLVRDDNGQEVRN